MDNTVRMWDVRPFVTGNRNVKTFFGVRVREIVMLGWFLFITIVLLLLVNLTLLA